MDIAIVGLPKSGKTTIFNAVTRGSAQVADYSGPGQPNVGVAKVPDGRLDTLEAIYGPKRVVPAEVRYVDVPAPPEGMGTSRGISGEYLSHLQRADALMVVARAFEDPAVSHVMDGVDPARDAETMLMELAFSDVEILERRLSRLADGFKGAKAPERDALTREQALLTRLKDRLEDGAAVRLQLRTPDEARALEGFQLLTDKPVIVVANLGEEQLPEASVLEARLAEVLREARVEAAALCGRLEMELAQMEPDDEQEFRESLGAGESGLDRMIALSYLVADLITFFTGNDNEVRAWTAARGTEALKAAGKVHSDFERGFIRAEVVAFDALAECGGLAEARRRGVLRQEGKGYVVQDGDVLNILFNV